MAQRLDSGDFAGQIPSNVPQLTGIHSIRHHDRARQVRARFRVCNRTYSSGFPGCGCRPRPANARSPHDPQTGQCTRRNRGENPNPASQIAREQVCRQVQSATDPIQPNKPPLPERAPEAATPESSLYGLYFNHWALEQKPRVGNGNWTNADGGRTRRQPKQPVSATLTRVSGT